MAIRIEKGGWIFIFLIGLGLVGYSLNKYGVLDLHKWLGSRSARSGGEVVDPSKPLAVPSTAASSAYGMRPPYEPGR